MFGLKILENWQKLQKWDWRVIVLCLLISTFVWLFSSLNKEYTTKIDYPLAFVFDQSKIVSLIELPKSIEIEVTGQGWILLKQTLNFYVEPLNVKIKTPTKASFLTPRAIFPLLTEAVPELKISTIPQDTIWFQFNFLAEKRVLLYLDPNKISLDKGYFLTSDLRLNPQYVKFKGASSLIESMKDTLFLELPDKKINNKNYSVHVNIPTKNTLVPNFPQVAIFFNTDFFVEKSMNLNIISQHFPKDSSVYLKESTAKVFYWAKNKDKTKDTLQIIAKFENLNWKDSTIVPEINFAEDFRNIRVEPPIFKVNYAKKHHKNRNHGGNRNR